MWMAVSGLDADAAELLFGISPDVFVGSEPFVHFVDLRKVYRYWAMGAGFEPLTNQLHFLDSAHHAFVLAPTAAQAALFLATSTSFSRIVLSHELESAYQQIPIERLISMDRCARPTSERLVFWSQLIEYLCDLGLETLGDLCAFAHRSDLILRWGKPLQELLSLARGQSDWLLAPLEPKMFFEAHVNFALERHLSSDVESDLIKRIEQILTQWNLRLRFRRLRIGGLQVDLRSELRGRSQSIVVNVPRALSSALDFLPMLRERFEGTPLESQLHGVDGIAEVSLRSLKLEPDFDVQLHLLEPDQESLDQDWSQAIGHMYSFAKQEGDLRFGVYVPAHSYLPESSLQWADGVMDSSLPPFDDHPARPTLLLKRPELSGLAVRSYDEFMAWVAQHGLYLGLEKLLNPWVKDAGLRIYAKYQSQWLFWSSRDQRVYLHGYF